MKKNTVILLLVILSLALTGCWDKRELDAIFIVTGISLDASKEPEKMEIAFQIGKPVESTGKKEAGGGEKSFIMLNTISDSVAEALLEIDRDISRKLLLQHNQLILVGSALAEQGLKNRLDYFIRDYESRMEVLIMIAEGNANEVLNTEMQQDKITGMFITRLMKNLTTISPHFQVRLLDVLSRFIDGSSGVLIPLIEQVENEDQKRIKMVGMGVLKNEKLVGRLNNDQVAGYIWTMGDVKKWTIEVKAPMGKAAFEITKLNSKKKINLDKERGILVEVPVETELIITELEGFSEYDPKELMSLLKSLVEDRFHNMMMETFAMSQEYNADIYRFGTMILKQNPKKWKEMKENWDEIYPTIQLVPKVKARIVNTGVITKSVEMEEQKSEI